MSWSLQQNFLAILSPILNTTFSKSTDEQLKLVHKEPDLVDCPYRKICVTLLQYDVDKRESSFSQIRLFARKKGEENFKQMVYEN